MEKYLITNIILFFKNKFDTANTNKNRIKTNKKRKLNFFIELSMKISIITPTFNSEQFLSENLQSVIMQKYKIFEHIFIDNKSTDGTLEILKNYKKSASYNVIIYSSKDRGIYHAFNKGLKKTKGDLITILNSDDYLTNKFVLKNI